MTDALKPCPFCGGDAITVEDSEHSTAYSLQHFSKGCPIDDLWDWYPDQDQAIAAWNTRADTATLAPASAPAVDPLADPRVVTARECLERIQDYALGDGMLDFIEGLAADGLAAITATEEGET